MHSVGRLIILRENQVVRVVAEVHLGDILHGKLPSNPKVLELIGKVSQGGQLAPIHVRPVVGQKGKFVLLTGKYQYMAAKLMGLRTISVRFSPKLSRKVH